VVPHRIVHAEADEPAKEQVVVDLLDQQPLRTDGVNTRNDKARRIYSGAIEGRPEVVYSSSNPGLTERNTWSVSLRTARKG
jgi:hypothetical protein